MATKRSNSERLYFFIRHIGRRLRDIDVAQGTSPARISALAHLVFHGVDNVGAMADHERVSRPAMTRLVRDMERAGLVKRRSDKHDGRATLVEVTDKGRAAAHRARDEKVALIAKHVERLDRETARAVALALDVFERIEQN
jgi:DNA-binding MarR family transcriptional regulator